MDFDDFISLLPNNAFCRGCGRDLVSYNSGRCFVYQGGIYCSRNCLPSDNLMVLEMFYRIGDIDFYEEFSIRYPEDPKFRTYFKLPDSLFDFE